MDGNYGVNACPYFPTTYLSLPSYRAQRVSFAAALQNHTTTILSTPDPVLIARQLIGAEIVTLIDGVETGVFITETEAYWAPDDRASHAFGNKRTKRTEVFFHAPGTAYVYLCYGIHEMFNVVTGPEGTPHAVLIRAGEPSRGIEHIMGRRKQTKVSSKLSTGPGVLTKALGIDRRFNGLDLLGEDSRVRLILREEPLPETEVIAAPRVGINYAGEPSVSKPWRFCRRGSGYLSRKDLIKEL